MPKFSCGSYDHSAIETVVNDFKSRYPVRVNIETNAGIDGNGDPYIEIVDSEVPVQITFMTFGIDVSNLDIILTPHSLLPPIRVSSLTSLLSSVVGKGLDSGEVLRALEIYKMNGKLEEFASNLNSSNSVAGSVTGSFVSDLTSKLDREVRIEIINALHGVNRFCDKLCRNLSRGNPVSNSYRYAMDSVPPLPTGLSDAKYYELSVSGQSYLEGVTDIKSANIVEMADLVMDGEDIVFSSDIKKSLTKLGFDKLITSRELTSLSNAVQKHALEAQTSRYNKTAPHTHNIAKSSLQSWRGVQGDVLSAGDMSKMFTLLIKIAKVFKKGE